MCVGDGCKPSDWHFVSCCCVLGVRYKSSNWHLVSSVGLFGSESDVSPAIGIRFPCLPVCVCFGSDADVIPSSGCQAPCLPSVCVFCVVWRA